MIQHSFKINKNLMCIWKIPWCWEPSGEVFCLTCTLYYCHLIMYINVISKFTYCVLKSLSNSLILPRTIRMLIIWKKTLFKFIIYYSVQFFKRKRFGTLLTFLLTSSLKEDAVESCVVRSKVVFNKWITSCIRTMSLVK